MKFSVILLLLCTLLWAQTKSGYMIILGGGKDAAAAQKALIRYKQKSQLWANFEPAGYPKEMLSDTVTGLNPGFHIAVAGVCEQEEMAKLFLEIITTDMGGVYIRKVTMNSSEVTGAFQATQYIKSRVLKLKNRVITGISNRTPSCTTSGDYNWGGGPGYQEKEVDASGLLMYRQDTDGDWAGNSQTIYCVKDQFKVFEDIRYDAVFVDGRIGYAVERLDTTISWCYFVDEKPVALYSDYTFEIIGGDGFTPTGNYYLEKAVRLRRCADSLLCK